jgi:PilZ domain
MNQRQHERYIVEFPARFAGDCEGTGIVYNLGLGGCKLVTDRPLAVGGMLAFILDIPQEAFAVRCELRQAVGHRNMISASNFWASKNRNEIGWLAIFKHFRPLPEA